MNKLIVNRLKESSLVNMWETGMDIETILRYQKFLGMVVIEDGVERELVRQDIEDILSVKHSKGNADGNPTKQNS